MNIHGEHKNLRKILIFGIGSAICLVIHSIFLGIIFEADRKQLTIHIPSLIIVLAISLFFALFQNFSYRVIFDLTLMFAFGVGPAVALGLFIVSRIFLRSKKKPPNYKI